MPFGLRNAEATYQIMVDKVFEKHIGRNVEVYVDDMVIKIKGDEGFLKDIEETMIRLRETNMKLNLKKCVFGVQKGKFLGHIVSLAWIEANPEKVRPLLDLKTPCMVRDMYSLNGKLAALGRFLVKSTEQSLLVYQALKNHVGKSDVAWSKKAGGALLKLKEHLRKLPTLASPKPNYPLIIYLSIN